MKTRLKLLIIGGSALAFTGCANFGDPSVYGHLNCDALRTQYRAETSLTLPDVLATQSDFRGANEDGEVRYPNRTDVDYREKERQSDLRAAYAANGC